MITGVGVVVVLDVSRMLVSLALFSPHRPRLRLRACSAWSALHVRSTGRVTQFDPVSRCRASCALRFAHAAAIRRMVDW